MQTLKLPRYLPVIPITIPLEYPLENRYKVTGTLQQTPQGKLKGVLQGGTAPPPGILTILIHRPSPWTSFTGVGMVAGFAISGLYTNSAEEWQKVFFHHYLKIGQKTMTGAYIPCAYQQGIVHDAPLLSGNGGRGPVTSYPFLSCLPYPLPPRPVFSQIHTLLPIPCII